jgi:hypothetical protein
MTQTCPAKGLTKYAARRPIPKVFAQTKVLRIARVQNKGADVRY